MELLKKYLPEILFIISSLNDGSSGRYKLSKQLGISEFTVRKILEELNRVGLTATSGKSSGRVGNSLTIKGKELANNLSKQFLISKTLPSELIVLLPENMSPYLFVFKSDSKSLFNSNGVYERDMVVRSGGHGAILLTKSDKGWIFPNSNDSNIIMSNTMFSRFNWLLVSLGKTPSNAIRGGLSVIIYYCEDKFLQIFSEINSN